MPEEIKESVADQDQEQLDLPLEQQEEEVQATEQEPSPPPPSVRELASSHGVDLSEYEDDESAIKHLAEQARLAKERNELAQYGQQFIQHASDGTWQQYQQWKQQQAQEQPQEPKLWEPPEWNPSWLQQVRQDDQGNLVPDTSRGGNPETVAKVQRYIAWRQDQQDRFWQNPFEYMKPFVEQQSEARAKELIRQELSQYGEQLDARHFIATNKDWLYQQDNGQVKYQDGRPLMTQEGQVFFNALQRVNDKNWSSADKQEYALEKLHDYRQMQQLKTADPKAKKEQELAKAAGFTPPSSGTEAKPETSPQNENATFSEMLRAEFAAAGVDPNDELVQV